MSIETRRMIADFIAAKMLKTPDRRLGFDEPLLSRGLIDSLNLVDLALFVEDAFGVRLQNAELNASSFDTIEQLADLIARRRKE
jgi:acyl carrier protein